VNPKATFVRGDVRNLKALDSLFRRVRFDVVNHHAAQIDVRRSVEDPAFDAQVNIIGILNLLKLSRDYKVKKFLFASSGGTVYGECRRAADESFPEVPLSPYGVAKLASEKYILSNAALYGLRFTIFRYANVYGPRQDPHGEAGVVAIFSRRLLGGQPITIFGDGKQTRDFVYVGDVARASLLGLSRAHNEIVNIGTARSTSVVELYQRMARIVGEKRKAAHKPARNGELRRSLLAIGKARRVLGWKPEVSIDEGLSRTIDFFRTLDTRQ
jgi:UDP-glucose 4-epimerase